MNLKYWLLNTGYYYCVLPPETDSSPKVGQAP